MTIAMSPDVLNAPHGLDEFRMTAPREIATMLRRLCENSVQLDLNASDGGVVRGTVWAVDAARGSVGFNVDPNNAALPGILERDKAVVVGLLDNVRLQFDVTRLVLVHGVRTSMLNCGYPRELFRFQRRGAYRVRPLLRAASVPRVGSVPMARINLVDLAGGQIALRVLDVSIGGCALFMPDDTPPMPADGLMREVQIDLDADTHVQADLQLHHVTSLDPELRGVRLGCEFVRADPAALRTLQRFIDLTQKRGKLLALD